VHWMRAAVSAAALIALVAVVGTLAYVSARDDRDRPATTTTTTSPLTPEAAAAAVADALATGLATPLTPDEARCVADGMVDALGLARLEVLAAAGGGGDLSPADRDALVQTVVGCLPEVKAAGLLGSGSTTTIVAQLPDEGAGG
jgi:hypothetical protein